jgi:hypothetical protein
MLATLVLAAILWPLSSAEREWRYAAVAADWPRTKLTVSLLPFAQ